MLNELDQQIVRWAVRLGAIRHGDATALTGASVWTVRKRKRALTAAGYLENRPWSIWLRDGAGKQIASQVWAATATAKGAQLAGEWSPTGYGEQRLTLGRTSASSRLTSDHLLGVAHLAAEYSQWGAVISEREIAAMELPVSVGRTRRPARAPGVWTVPVMGQQLHCHVPDLAVVWGGQKIAVELERACKDEIDYARLLTAYRLSGLAQVWHVGQRRTLTRLLAAGSKAGVQWSPTVYAGGVRCSRDGQARLAPWAPGRAATGGPAGWLAGYDLDRPPALLPPVPRLDRTLAWRTGVVIDPDAERQAA